RIDPTHIVEVVGCGIEPIRSDAPSLPESVHRFGVEAVRIRIAGVGKTQEIRLPGLRLDVTVDCSRAYAIHIQGRVAIRGHPAIRRTKLTIYGAGQNGPALAESLSGGVSTPNAACVFEAPVDIQRIIQPIPESQVVSLPALGGQRRLQPSSMQDDVLSR